MDFLGGRGVNTYGFGEQLAFSRGQREATDKDTIKKMIDGCVDCVKTDEATDKRGVDYVATLRRGARVLIDAKARQPGARKYWGPLGPDLALEIWSVIPGPDSTKKTGWTLSETSEVGLILFTFDSSDTNDCFLVSAQHLRIAFRRSFALWTKLYKPQQQRTVSGSTSWLSESVFVPACVVLAAITDVSKGTLKTTEAPSGVRQLVLFDDRLTCSQCRRGSASLDSTGRCPDCEWRAGEAS